MNSKAALILIILVCRVSLLIADDAPMCYTHGGNVRPIKNDDIQLYNETIDITLYNGYYEVEVNYKFINKGKAQTVIMGFPSDSATSKDMNFKAFDNGKELVITPMKTNLDYIPPAGLSCQRVIPKNEFQCHTVYFKENETKYIKNTYYSHYDPSYRDEPLTSFSYILTTGSFWKDSIVSAIIRLNTDNTTGFDLVHGGYLNNDSVSLLNFYKEYKNFEPREDLVFGMHYKNELVVWGANTTLSSSGSINYGITNLSDNKKFTAWVEGRDDWGRNEVVWFLNPFGNSSMIKSIGIINGYAKNQETFSENNRISLIKISTSNNILSNIYNYKESENSEDVDVIDIFKKRYKSGALSKTEYIFCLKDIPEMQYFHFDKSVEASSISFEILRVYKGTKFNDTAISEIVFIEDK